MNWGNPIPSREVWYLEMVMHLGAGFGEVWGWFGDGLGRLGGGLG